MTLCQRKRWGGTLRHSPHLMPMALSIRWVVTPQRCHLSYDTAKIRKNSELYYILQENLRKVYVKGLKNVIHPAGHLRTFTKKGWPLPAPFNQ